VEITLRITETNKSTNDKRVKTVGRPSRIFLFQSTSIAQKIIYNLS